MFISPFFTINNTHIINSIIAKEVIDLLASKVYRMLCILYMPNVEDSEMRELVFRLSQTSK